MTKRQITLLWAIGIGIFVVGLVMFGVSLGAMFTSGGHFVRAVNGSGYEFVPDLGSVFWTTVTFMVIGGAIMAIGGLAQLAAWIGALVNTWRLADRTWFAVLLGGGLLGLMVGLTQFAVMLAYVIAGPDATAPGAERAPLAPPSTPAPSAYAPS
ncbi:MAG TPA: hypothetical protein VF725_03640 [Ktedonobacterales bacterium]|jgi:hypothetical protein